MSINWHMDYLADELQEVVIRAAERKPKEADLLINIPPGTSKSTICTIMLPAWAWAIDPTLRIMTASYSASLSMAHAVKSRDVIRSQRYRELFPEVKIKPDQDNKTNYENTAGGQRYATSTTGTITGFHAHLIIVDDPLNAQEAASIKKLEGAEQFINNTIATRKVNKDDTPTILVMQRLHEKDPSGLWIENESAKHICLPAILSDDVKPESLKEKYSHGLLDPKRMGEETLNGLRKSLGSYGFAGQFMQTPVPIEGALWQSEWFHRIPKREIPELQFLGTDFDLAYTKDDRNSASAWITAGSTTDPETRERRMYILDAGAVHAEFPELISRMKGIQAPHYVEAKASGKSAVQTLKAQGIPAIEVNVQGGDKIARATLMSPYAEAGQVYVADHIYDFLMHDVNQGLVKFPNAKDDLNDALVQAINRLLNKKKVVVF